MSTAGKFLDACKRAYERDTDTDVAASGIVETADGEQVTVHLTQAALNIAR